MSKRLLKILSWAWENLPLAFCAALTLFTTITGDNDAARFFILMGLIFVILRDIHDLKQVVIKHQHCQVNVDEGEGP